MVAQTVDTKLRTSTLAVGVQLSLGWNTYVLFNNILNFVWKTDEWEEESIALLIFVLWRCLNFRWMSGGRGGGRPLLLWQPLVKPIRTQRFEFIEKELTHQEHEHYKNIHAKTTKEFNSKTNIRNGY